MLDFKNTATMREDMAQNWDWEAEGKPMPLYGSHIRNRNANGYIKIGMPVGPSVYDPDEQDEMRSNLAFVADFDHFDEDAYFGLNTYEGNQNAAALNLMYNHYFTYRSSLIVGVQAHLDYYRERLVNPTPWIPGTAAGGSRLLGVFIIIEVIVILAVIIVIVVCVGLGKFLYIIPQAHSICPPNVCSHHFDESLA